MRTEDPHFTEAEFHSAWHQAMSGPITFADVRAARRLLRDFPWLRSLEPRGRDVAMARHEITALLGPGGASIPAREFTAALRLIALARAIRIASRRRENAPNN